MKVLIMFIIFVLFFTAKPASVWAMQNPDNYHWLDNHINLQTLEAVVTDDGAVIFYGSMRITSEWFFEAPNVQIIERGFVYSSVNSSHTVGNYEHSITAPQPASNQGVYNASLNVWGMNVTYYYRAYVRVWYREDESDQYYTMYGNPAVVNVAFDQSVNNLTVNTLLVSSVTENSAVFNGNFNVGNTGFSENNNTYRAEQGFVYSRQSMSPTIQQNEGRVRSLHTRNVFGNFHAAAAQLAPGTTYYVRAYVNIMSNNQYDTIYGSTHTFQTQNHAAPPALHSLSFDMLQINSARLSAVLSGPAENIREMGFVYSRFNRTPTINDTRAVHDRRAHTQGPFNVEISSLLSDMNYYFRAYAILSHDEVIYSDTSTFRTSDVFSAVTVTAAGASGAGLDSATLSGALDTGGMSRYVRDMMSMDLVKEKGFVYSHINRLPGLNDIRIAHPDNSEGNYYLDIGGLLHGTAYYFRAYAVLGDDRVIFSDRALSFVTGSPPPPPRPHRDEEGNVIIDYGLLQHVHCHESAAAAIRAVLAYWTHEDKENPVNVCGITLFAEYAISNASARMIPSTEFVLTHAMLMDIVPSAELAKHTVLDVLSSEGIRVMRHVRTILKLYSTGCRRIAMTINSFMVVPADRVLIQNPAVAVSINEVTVTGASRQSPVVITAEPEFDGYKIFTQRRVTAHLPAIPVNPIYLGVVDEFGERVVSKFNPALNTVDTVVHGNPEKRLFVRTERHNFLDVPLPYYNIIHDLYSSGVVSGMSDTRFAPYENISRAQIATMLVKALNINYPTYNTLQFPDVQGRWFDTVANAARVNNLMVGRDDGMFDGDKIIDRAEITTAYARALVSRGGYRMSLLPEAQAWQRLQGSARISDQNDIYSNYRWAVPYVDLMVFMRIFIADIADGSPRFSANAQMNRIDAAVLMRRVYQFIWE
jgi:hypothetical protein